MEMITRALTKYATQMILTGELFVHLIDLPCMVEGVSCPNPDGTYSVFINTRHTHSIQREAFYHEIAHIYYKDHQRDISAGQIEAMRRL